jgi:hypothetical protein
VHGEEPSQEVSSQSTPRPCPHHHQVRTRSGISAHASGVPSPSSSAGTHETQDACKCVGRGRNFTSPSLLTCPAQEEEVGKCWLKIDVQTESGTVHI